MATPSPSQPIIPCKIPVPIIIAGPIITIGPQWLPYFIDFLLNRLGEECFPFSLAPMKVVAYEHVCFAANDPVYSMDGHDEGKDIVVINEESSDLVAHSSYKLVVKDIEDLEARHPGQEFSFFVWHIVAGQHGFQVCDPGWKIACGELMKPERNIILSMDRVILDDCLIFERLFSEISPASSRKTPWFPTAPNHKVVSSSSMPSGGQGAVPSLMYAAHPAPPISVPSNIEVTSLNFPPELPAHGTRFPDDSDQGVAPPFSSHARLDVHAHVPTYSNQNYMTVPEAQGLIPIDLPAPLNNSGAEHQRPTPHGYTEMIISRDGIANTNTRSMSSGLSDKIGTIEYLWTGILNLKGKRVYVGALIVVAVGYPKLSDLSEDLGVEPADGPILSILDIEAWILKYKAPVVRLVNYVEGTGNYCDFGQFIQEVRVHGYATVTCGDGNRLLLAPLGTESLLCAAFPDKGTPKPTPQPPRKLRTEPPKETGQRKRGSRKKKGEPHDPQPTVEWQQKAGFSPSQMVSPPQFQVKQHTYPQASQGFGVLGPDGWWVDTDAAGCIGDPSNIESEAMEFSDMNNIINEIEGDGD